MGRPLALLLLSCLMAIGTGCSGSNGDSRATGPPTAQRDLPATPEPGLKPPPPPPPPPPPDGQEPATQPPAVRPSTPVPSPAVRPRPPLPPATGTRPSTAARGPSIALSLPVALPQTGPAGIMMMFSVEYRFTAGGPESSNQYVWVIEPASGNPLKQPVRLKTEGKLQGAIHGLRPEHGPFYTHLEDARGNRLSRSVELD